MAIIAIVIVKISFGKIRNINIATAAAVPNQILRPSDAPIAISTKIAIKAVKILENGYDAIGVTLKLWENKDKKTNKVIDSDCNSVDAINGAKLVCDRLGVHHYTLDFIDLFRSKVVNDFASEYFSGRTPNPCIRCNSIVKWDALINQL